MDKGRNIYNLYENHNNESSARFGIQLELCNGNGNVRDHPNFIIPVDRIDVNASNYKPSIKLILSDVMVFYKTLAAIQLPLSSPFLFIRIVLFSSMDSCILCNLEWFNIDALVNDGLLSCSIPMIRSQATPAVSIIGYPRLTEPHIIDIYARFLDRTIYYEYHQTGSIPDMLSNLMKERGIISCFTWQ